MNRRILLFFFILIPLFEANLYAENGFSSSVEPLSQAYQDKFLKENFWNEDCPVKLTELSDLKVSYWGMDEKVHQGEIIVHKKLAWEVVNIFYELFLMKFPISEMKPYQSYPRETYAEHNDTVGYYCSPAQDKNSVYSAHAYGTAIDINPLFNPFLDEKLGWWPKGSASYSDRNQKWKGSIHVEDPVFDIFTQHGWIWGGLEKDKDYMHFSKGMSGNYLISQLIYLPNNEKIRDSFKKVTEQKR